MRKTLHSLAVLLVVLGVYIGSEVFCYYRTVPPSCVQTLDGYMRWRPDSDRFLIHRVDGKEFLEVLAPGGALLPSGPAGYVFDRSGKMVDWTHDSGDDSAFQQKWRESHEVPDTSRQVAERWLRNASNPG